MENHKTDDRMEDLMQKVREGRGTDAACMLDYCTQIEEYAERAGDARLLGFSHYYKGRTYYLSNETGKVFEEIGEALGYLEQSGQWELVAAAYNLMAIVSVGKGNLSFAIEYYLAGLKYCKKYELIEVESRIESNLGSCIWSADSTVMPEIIWSRHISIISAYRKGRADWQVLPRFTTIWPCVI